MSCSIYTHLTSSSLDELLSISLRNDEGGIKMMDTIGGIG